VLEDSERDVVTHQTLCRAEEAEVAHDNSALIIAQSIRLPQLNVLTHRNFCGEPIVSASIEIMLPSPLVLKWHELVNINGAAVDEALIRDSYPL
jgi:hypothetical protein